MVASPTELQQAGSHDVAEVVSLLNRAYRGSGDVSDWTTEVGPIDGDRGSEALLAEQIAGNAGWRHLANKR